MVVYFSGTGNSKYVAERIAGSLQEKLLCMNEQIKSGDTGTVKTGENLVVVVHGSSSVPQEYVKIINTHGGALKDAVGIPEEQLRKAAKSAVCKINIDSDGRLAMTAAIRKIFVDQPAEFDPRKYLGPARDELKKLYMHKCESVLGSAGKA